MRSSHAPGLSINMSQLNPREIPSPGVFQLEIREDKQTLRHKTQGMTLAVVSKLSVAMWKKSVWKSNIIMDTEPARDERSKRLKITLTVSRP